MDVCLMCGAALLQKNPARFGQLQRDFIEQSHYEPAKDKILTRTGIDMNTPAPGCPGSTGAICLTPIQQELPAFLTKSYPPSKKSPATAFAQKLIDAV